MYRITPTWPADQNALCVFWRGKIYVDRAVAFGLTSSAGVFGSVADMLVTIYVATGFGPIKKWVDDFLVIRLPGQSWSEDDFIALTAALGVPWSRSKTRPLAVVQRYIGFDWDVQGKTVALPKDKLAKVLDLVKLWSTDGARFRAHEAAQLQGKLVHVATIFPLVRPFVRSIAYFERSFKDPRAKLNPPKPLISDLSWVRFILESHPRTIPLSLPEPIDIGWWGDASTSFGIGIAVGQYWAVWRWVPGFEVGSNKSHDIGWAEAVAVEFISGLTSALTALTEAIINAVSANKRCKRVISKSQFLTIIAIYRTAIRAVSAITHQCCKDVSAISLIRAIQAIVWFRSQKHHTEN
jgi:hypothetical protein